MARPIRRLWRLFQRFAALETASGLLLLACTLFALLWANSPWGKSYEALKTFPLSLSLGGFQAQSHAVLFINDVLMAVFFLLVGLEIKREMLTGELASLRKSLLPMAGALGGMVVPALIYAAFTHGKAGAEGWGVPMATDIAFALGAITALGKRVPLALKVFLVALAIIDDIGAILVIAFFYSTDIHFGALGLALLALLVLGIMNREEIHHPLPYLLGGVALWFTLHHGGVHATLAGVLLAIAIPHKWPHKPGAIPAEPLLRRWETGLHPYVSFLILPLFALANAGVAISAQDANSLLEPVGMGIILGLCLGKPLGITLFAWLAVRLRLGQMPDGVTWPQLIGAGLLAGIGFTMSLFVAHLGLEKAGLLDQAKLAILVASTSACILGIFWLTVMGRPKAR